MVFKLSLAHLKAPTPKKIRQIGNALITISSTVALPVSLAGNLYIAGALAGAGILGKVLLSFYAEDGAVSQENTGNG